MLTILFLFQIGFAFNPFEVHEEMKNEFQQELASQGLYQLRFLLDEESPENLGGAQRNRSTGTLMIGSDFFNPGSKNPLTLENFLFIYCHELGHLIGGAPYKTKSGSEWSSTEGQADYWATAVCLRRALKIAQGDEYTQKISQLSIEFFQTLRMLLGTEASQLGFYQLPQAHQVEPARYESEYASFQCRYEIHMAGAELTQPPACWVQWP